MSSIADPETPPPERPASVRDVFRSWWPLAASWLLMAVEVPMVSAFIARLADPRINLAAFGGLVYPLLLLFESPVIMLLVASTTLSRDMDSYERLRRYMAVMSGALTVLHAIVVLTPVYGILGRQLIGAPEQLLGPARVGLIVALPWTFSIAYRRFQQGVLIRYGYSRVISIGTGLRLVSSGGVLALGAIAGFLLGDFPVPGVVIGTLAVVAGVMAESRFIGKRTVPVLEEHVAGKAPLREVLDVGKFVRFYLPLAMTSLLGLIMQPVGAAALSRMPLAIPSLATWPVVTGLLFMLRSPGIAYKEVVVAILDRPDSYRPLMRFTRWLSGIMTIIALAIVLTPMATLWLRRVSGLDEDLVVLGRRALLVGALIPALGVLQNWYVGFLVYTRQTRAVTESMFVFLGVSIGLLLVGVLWADVTGLYVALSAFVVGNVAQLGWARHRALPGLRRLRSGADGVADGAGRAG